MVDGSVAEEHLGVLQGQGVVDRDVAFDLSLEVKELRDRNFGGGHRQNIPASFRELSC